MTFKVRGLKEENARRYNGLCWTLIAHKNSCCFCKNLSDLFYDFTHGPYLFFCDKGIDVDNELLLNGCSEFEEDI